MTSVSPGNARSASGANWYRIRREPIALVAFALLAGAFLAAALAPIIAPHSPDVSNVRLRLSPPGMVFVLGADLQGRDMITRLLYGLRTSLFIASLALLISASVGILVGLLAAFYRRLDGPLMRIVDVLLAFPAILVGLALAAALGSGLASLLIALGLSGAPVLARVSRAAAHGVLREQYVEGGRAAGVGDLRLLVRYVALNSMPTILVYMTLQFGHLILMGAALSFLGLGPQPPIAELGLMAAQGRDYLSYAPHVALLPSLLIFVIALSANVMGDTLRDILDPRLRGR